MTASTYVTDSDILIALELRRRAKQPAMPKPSRWETHHQINAAQTDPMRVTRYISTVLGWEPWPGTPEAPGQQEAIAAYVSSLAAQHQRPDDGSVPNRIRIAAGHGIGKTKIAAGLVSHFFDTYPGSIIYTFAPTWEQIHDLLWKEIKADRTGKDLPGRLLDLAIDGGPAHFAKGRATSNANGQGTERVQGQHGPYLMFVLDEAEGVADYVYDAIESMTSGGISIVLLLANPRTRNSRFHKAAAHPRTQSFCISCLAHPNVREGREIVPGAVRRAYVDTMISEHCVAVPVHEPDSHTFSVPWRPGLIYRPNAEFCFRVLGIAPSTVVADVLCPSGRYEAAVARQAVPSGEAARIGVDAARYGTDMGTVYAQRGPALWRVAQLAQVDTLAYYRTVKQEAEALAADGVTSLHVRVDGGGGYGAGCIDLLRADLDLSRHFADFQVFEVHFNGTPYDATEHADKATELYAHLAEALHTLALPDAPEGLEQDVTERRYSWATQSAEGQRVDVKKLESKEAFRKRIGRSPDDGDGAALAAAPDYIVGSSDGVYL